MPAKKTSSKKAPKKKFCIQTDCKNEAKTDGYCRLHYLANWRRLRLNQQIKNERRLNAYVDRIAKKYPDDYLERIKEGLESEDKFKQSVQELDLESDEMKETEREFLEKLVRKINDE